MNYPTHGTYTRGSDSFDTNDSLFEIDQQDVRGDDMVQEHQKMPEKSSNENASIENTVASKKEPLIDSVPIDAESSNPKPAKKIKWGGLKLLIILFFIFLLVVSDVFVNNVLPIFGKSTVDGRHPTTSGQVVQGIFLVLFFILANYLVAQKIL